MKINNLKIYDPNDKEIQNIDFETSGCSIIYGKVEVPDEITKTSNSIGKTLLLKFIGYILGKQEKSKDYSPVVKGFSLRAEVSYKGEKHTVERILGDSKSLKVDGVKMSYKKYLDYFEMRAGLNSKQMFFKRRSHIISDVNPNPDKNDISNVLELLNIINIIDYVNNIRDLQSKVKAIKDFSKSFETDLAEYKQKEFLLKQERNKYQNDLTALSIRMQSLEISQDSVNLIEEHSNKKYELKNLKMKEENLKNKAENLEKLIEEYKKADLSSEEILSIFQMSNISIPEMVKRSLEEVQTFYKEMFTDKIYIYKKDIKIIRNMIQQLEIQITDLIKVTNDLASKIADNQLFKESMSIYELRTEELRKIDLEYGEVTGRISNISKKNDFEHEILSDYLLLEKDLDDYEVIIERYREFIYNLVAKVYGNNSSAFFDITVSTSKRRIESLPIIFELSLKGDFGEGLSAVKNLLIDILIFYYNRQIEFLIHDSSCFEGIDKRQLSSIIKIINDYAKEIDKQYILSINEYHILSSDNSLIELVNKNSVIELSEEEKLLKFDF